MNTIDLIVLLALGLAVWSGWRRGFVVQVGSLAGLALVKKDEITKKREK